MVEDGPDRATPNQIGCERCDGRGFIEEATQLLLLVRESGGEFGMVVGRGTDADPDEIVDVQIAATGKAASALVRVVEDWHKFWTGEETS